MNAVLSSSPGSLWEKDGELTPDNLQGPHLTAPGGERVGLISIHQHGLIKIKTSSKEAIVFIHFQFLFS